MPLQVGKHSLNLTVSLAFLAFFPLAELPLELQLVGEEHLSPAHILGQGPHVRGDVVTGGLNYWLPQFVRDAQLEDVNSLGSSREILLLLQVLLIDTHSSERSSTI